MSSKKRMSALDFWLLASEEIEDIRRDSRRHYVDEEVYLADVISSSSGTHEVELLQIDEKLIYVVIDRVVHILNEKTLYDRHMEIISLLHE